MTTWKVEIVGSREYWNFQELQMEAVLNYQPTEMEVDLAYHEAGHAVAAWVNGVGLLTVQLSASSGRVRAKLPFKVLVSTFMSDGDWQHLRYTALSLLAGEYAERGFHEVIMTPSVAYCSAHDRAELNELWSLLFGDCAPPAGFSISELESEADRLIEQNWDRVQALASRLLAQRTLSGAEAESVIESAALTAHRPGRGPIVWE